VGDHIAYVWAIPFRGRTQKIKFDIKCRTDATKIRLPCKTDKDFCQFLGYFVGDGDIKGNRLVRITDKDRSNLEFYQALAKKVFGIEGKIKFDGRQRLIFCSAMLAKFLRNFGIQKSAQRTIPAIIQRTSKKQLASFLRGLFDAEGCVVISTNRGILLASASQDMAQVVQLLLLRFGIHSEIREVWRTVQGKRYKIYHLRIHSPASLRLFAKNISFDSRPKLEKLNSLLNTIGKGWSHLELIPIKKATLYNEIKRELKKVPQIFKTKFDLFATNKKGISRKQFERLIKELENYNLTELVAKLKMVKNYLWIKVLKKITIKSDTQYVYDIEIPGPSNYVANGFIVHNCQGGPVQSYIRWLYNREDCAMILNGYQIAGTPGRILLDTGRLVFGDLDIKPKMTVKFMDFSAHCGRDDLIDFYKKVNPGKIVLVHGDQTEAFAQELREMGFDAIAPRNGERIKI
jgi:intein/homing endonuclease